MARTRKKTLVKIGGLEISRRAPVAQTPSAGKPATEHADAKAPTKPRVGKSIGVAGNGPSAYGWSNDGEYLRKLQGPKGRAIYDEMRRSDPQVSTILQAIGLPIRQANYYIEPASNSATDREIAETAEADIFRNMTMTWDDTLRHILLMLPFGFSALEKVWEYRDDMIRPRKFDPRLPQSVVRWQWNTAKRTLIGPVQSDEDGNEILLPVEKLLVFTLGREGDNWEGISLLRPLYKPWYIKNTLEKINAIKHDRHGVGVPKAHMPAGVVEGSEEWEQAVNMLEDLQAQEQAYVVEPDGWSVDILGGGERAGTDAMPSIKYYDEAMARAALTMFVMLGQTESGSRALGESFTDIFRLSLQAYADYICEVINRFALREYVDYNWSVDEYPELKVRRIQRLDPATLQLLAQARLITPDLDLENALRDEMNLPERVEQGGDEPPEPDTSTRRDEPDEDAPDEEHEPDESENVDNRRGLAFADRKRTDEERLCNLDAIEMRLNTSTREVQDELLDLKQAQVQRIVDQIVAGRKVQDIVVPAKKEMHDILVGAYNQEYRTARKEAAEEMQRQVPSKQLADDTVDPSELFRLIEEELSIKVQGAADKLKTLIAEIALNLKKQGYVETELKAELEQQVRKRISDATWQALAATAVNQGWGAGRQTAMEQHNDEIREVYRSGILDANLCEVCAPKDRVTHQLGDPDYMAPDPACEGGPSRCRCINIAIMKDETEGVNGT